MKSLCGMCLALAAIIIIWVAYMIACLALSQAAPLYPPMPPHRPVTLQAPRVMTMPPLGHGAPKPYPYDPHAQPRASRFGVMKWKDE